ncbi:hypothetical protein [Aminipila butyrica]|uniref:hypothetical protein n=1 Tax=Aminipila butyrica TaxID=433296 RepID=UPI001FEC591C|nr:hypothetical protein [Aminipila butyrica]
MLKAKIFRGDTKKYSLGDIVSLCFYYTRGNRSATQNAEIIQLEPDGFIVEADQALLQAANENISAVIETGEYLTPEIPVKLEFINIDTELELASPANQVSIPQIESDIPNRNDFAIGSGYDVITSNACPTAVNRIYLAGNSYCCHVYGRIQHRQRLQNSDHSYAAGRHHDGGSKQPV